MEALLATCQDGLAGIRDRALLLFGSACGGRRRSEIVAATLEMVRLDGQGGFVFELGRSKTKQSRARAPQDIKPIVGEAATLAAEKTPTLLLRDSWSPKSRIRGPCCRTSWPLIMYDWSMASTKRDDLSTTHLAWLVESRAANQKAALELFKLFERYPEKMKSKALSRKAQHFVAACFSLWRAAFLADKTGLRSAVFEDARAFLGKMLVDNAITYPQDRNAREWTFNYYMTNATEALLRLSAEWSQIDEALNASWLSISKAIATTARTAPQRRWDRTQYALTIAIRCLQKDLKA